MKARSFLACATFAGLSLTACGFGGPAYDRPPPRVDKRVDMTTTLNFAPRQTTIRVGDTVEWRNVSPMEHTVTADPARARNPAHVRLPPGAESFHSGTIQPGQTYRRTFTVAGEYRYFCIPHEEQGMVGTLTVLPAGR